MSGFAFGVGQIVAGCLIGIFLLILAWLAVWLWPYWLILPLAWVGLWLASKFSGAVGRLQDEQVMADRRRRQRLIEEANRHE